MGRFWNEGDKEGCNRGQVGVEMLGCLSPEVKLRDGDSGHKLYEV